MLPTSSDYYAPQRASAFEMLDPPDISRMVILQPVFRGDVFRQVVDYPVIVEAWHKRNVGRHRRRWLAAFTPAERKKISLYHGRFHRWYLVSGTPNSVQIRFQTIALLRRAVQFFAEC